MVRTLDIATAKAEFEYLIEQARDCGASVIIERNGQPVAAIVPVQVLENQAKSRQGFREALHAFHAGLKTT